jgi:hypothetical protein
MASGLTCEECGCTSETARGWVAFLVRDPEDKNDPATTVPYCPPCASREAFPVRLHAAATYT